MNDTQAWTIFGDEAGGMSDYEQAAFMSHAGCGERQEIVTQIDQALQTRGYGMVRENVV